MRAESDRLTADPERWRRAREIYDSVVETPRAQWEPAVAARCAADTVMANEVLRLLAATYDDALRLDAPRFRVYEPDAAEGDLIGRYRVVRVIGRGGMGTVYEGRRADAEYDQRVAIKLINAAIGGDTIASRFRRERQILASLAHPNIARLIDGGTTQSGAPYLVMELVEGRPIDEYCNRERLTIEERLQLFQQVCDAVQHAHAKLIVHRDLKPTNVLVAADGTVKLLDFGIAKLIGDSTDTPTLTAAGLGPFTTAYASPEQLGSGAITIATDIYALGVLLHLILCGRTPLGTESMSPGDAVTAIRTHSAPAPSIAVDETAAAARGLGSAESLRRALKGDLDAIVLTALRKEPERRYATVDAFSTDVARYIRRERVLARRDTLGYRLLTLARRQRALAAGVSIAAVAVVGGGAVALSQAADSRREAARSEQVATFLTRLFVGEDAASGDAIVRLGSQGTIAQLLDSAVRRVPGEFADDPRTRARLYTAVGAHYSAQGRQREAAIVLDSAVRLARTSYGPESAAFATASLDLAEALLGRTGPAVAATHVRNALSALNGRAVASPELYDRALVMEAEVREFAGDVRIADSLAQIVIGLEERRTRAPTITRAWALRVLSGTRAWITRDPRQVAALYAHVVAISDSLGAPLTRERIEALQGEAETLVVLGRYVAAESTVQAGLEAAARGYGLESVEYASLLSRASTVHLATARTAADSARALAEARTAWVTVDRAPDVGAELAVEVGATYVSQLSQSGNLSEAARVATRAVARVEAQHVPVATMYAYLNEGLVRVAQHDGADAERALRAGEAALPRSGDLGSMLPRFHRPLAQALAMEGRKHEADSVASLDPPSAAIPRCSPGGDWRGC